MKKFPWIFYICGWCLLMSGCVNDLSDNTSADETGSLKLVYSIPEMAGARSLSANTRADEGLEILLLFFDATSDGSGAYLGALPASVQNELPNGVELLKLIEGENTPMISETKSYNVWAIANYTKNGLSKDIIIEKANDEKTNTEQKLKSALMVSNSGALKVPFLMSGSSVMSGKDKTITVALQRNVAQIKVINEIEGDGFKMTSLRLTNMRKSSYVMDMKGSFPTPFSSVPGMVAEPADDAKSLSVYAFENYAEGASDKELDAIVGGVLANGMTLYYRLSINRHSTESGQNTQKIDRNTSYTLKLIKINGMGMGTWEEAAAGAIDLITVAESNSWEENFDGAYTYASNGIGFAPEKASYQKELKTLESASDEDKKFKIKLYWSNMGTMMPTAPTEDLFEIEVVSTDGIADPLVTISNPTDRNGIECAFNRYGKADITVTYKEVSRIITIELTQPSKADLIVGNIRIAPYNVGGDDKNLNGNLYSVKGLSDACPRNWRLPTRQEFEDYATVTSTGFKFANEKGESVVLPFASGTDGGYWTLSIEQLGGLRNPIPTDPYPSYDTDWKEEFYLETKRTVIKGNSTDPKMTFAHEDFESSTNKYPVRCVSTVDPEKIFVKVDNVKYQLLESSATTILKHTEICDYLKNGWKQPDKEQLRKLVVAGLPFSNAYDTPLGIANRSGNYVTGWAFAWDGVNFRYSIGVSLDSKYRYSSRYNENYPVRGFCVREVTP